MPDKEQERLTPLLAQVTAPELEAVGEGGIPDCEIATVEVDAPGQAPPLPVITTVYTPGWFTVTALVPLPLTMPGPLQL